MWIENNIAIIEQKQCKEQEKVKSRYGELSEYLKHKMKELEHKETTKKHISGLEEVSNLW